MTVNFDAGVDVITKTDPLGFAYGPGVFGPEAEIRSLDAIRWSLLEPRCSGPDPVYAIAMDVGKEAHRSMLLERNLLFGIVVYAAGRLGREPVRSRGHVHGLRPGRKLTTPEIYEVWSGRGLIYMQESHGDDPGRCYVIEANPGDVVIVPPDWTHAAVNADPDRSMVFGAWCNRDYSFNYDHIRLHGGPAWYPVFDGDDEIEWLRNKNYTESELVIKEPGDYSSLGIEKGKSIYRTFEENPDAFLYVPDPELKADLWKSFTP